VERTSSRRQFHPLKSSAFHGALYRQQSKFPILRGSRRRRKVRAIYAAPF
jgi:hypothetical protein